MSLDPELLTTTFDVFRPFGTLSPLSTGNECRLIADLPCGRGSGLAGVLAWSHYLDCDPPIDVKDNVTRSPGTDSLLYADGDGVRSPSGAGNAMYVVVLVVTMNPDQDTEFQRVYLLRDTA